MNQVQAMELYAAGTSEGAQKGWDTRGRGPLKQIDKTNFHPNDAVKYVDHQDISDPEESAGRLRQQGYKVHSSQWIGQAGKADAEDQKDKFIERSHGKGRDVVHADIGQDGYMLHSVSWGKNRPQV